MKLKNLLQDDDAVSPVIGVILMVAITVILAAVIASFVLGLGDSADEVQPNTSFDFEYQNDSSSASANDALEVTLGDGDSLEAGNIKFRGSAGDSTDDVDVTWDFDSSSASGNAGEIEDYTGGLADNPSSGDEVTAGQGAVLTLDPNGSTYDISVVWETSDDTATLESDTGPNA